ncbi:MAG: hypothetical protein WAL63_09465, partial [Solirubrobacteraceae bacterium]
PAPTTPRPTPRREPKAKPGHTRRPGPSTTRGQLVNGRLISDVIPLPAGASPLVRPAPAAAAPAGAVREATRAPALPITLGPLAVIALLGLGARRELRGRRRWRDVLLRR